MNEIGLDHDIDHLYAVKTTDEVHEKGGKIEEFHSYCDGLPAPECSGNPLGYKFSQSSRGVLLAQLNLASYLSLGNQANIDTENLMSHTKPYFIAHVPAFAFAPHSNRNSVPFGREFYNIPEPHTIHRGNSRYQGFPEFTETISLISLNSTLIDKIMSVVSFPDKAGASRILQGFEWIGFFSSDSVKPYAENLFDIICSRFEDLMQCERGERDLVMLQHKFIIGWARGRW